MEFRKVIIDGKEYYEKIDDEKETHTDKKDAEGSDVGDQIKKELYDFIEKVNSEAKELGEKFTSGTKDLGAKIAVGTKDIGTKIATGTKDLGNKIAVGAKDLGKKIKTESERIFGKDKSVDPNSTEAKLLRLLPYMSKRETHELVEKLLENDETVKRLDLSTVMPFLSAEDCDTLFIRGIELEKEAMSLASAAHFVSRDCLHSVVDGYIDGKYPTLDIDSLYPCLADSDIKKIFYHILKTENNDK